MTRISPRSATATDTVPALVKRGSEALRLGRFKDAVEAFKQALRQDPQPQWRQALAEAYVGRAQGLAAKGMLKEAVIVIENTRAPDGTLAAPLLFIVCLIRLGQYQKAAEEVSRQLAIQRAVGGAMAQAGRARLADLAAGLSLCGAGKEPQGEGDDQKALREAASAALHAWSAGAPAEVVERHLAALPVRSAFRPLRLILKALISSGGKAAKAASLLAMVPGDGAFAPLAEAAGMVLDDDPQALVAGWNTFSAAARGFIAEVKGLPAEASGLLDRITEAERRGPAALFALLIRRPAGLPEAELREACRELLVRVPKQTGAFEKAFGPLSDSEKHRITALAAEADEEWLEAERHWCGLADSLERVGDPETDLAKGVIYRHLADLARKTGGLIGGEGDSDEDPKIYYLERSVEADPTYLPAMLHLVTLYREAYRDKDWYRAVDRALRAFPDDVAVLAQATDAAVARKSYKSAAGLARRLLAIDPINQPVRQRIIALQVAQARKQMRAARPDLASKTLNEAAEWERADMPVAVLRLAQGLVGMRLGQGQCQCHGAPAEARLREGVRLVGDGVAGWLRAGLEAALMGADTEARDLCGPELDWARQTPPCRETVLGVIGVIGQPEIAENKRLAAPWLARIERWLGDGARLDWPAGEFHIIAKALQHSGLFETLQTYADRAVRRVPQDGMARFYAIVARVRGDARRLWMQEEDDLAAFLEQSAARQDFQTVREVTRFLDGPAPSRLSQKAKRGAARRGGLRGDLEAEEQQMLIEMIVSQLPDIIPKKDIRRMLNEIGRTATLDQIAAFFQTSPAGEVLTPVQMRDMAEAAVRRALEPGKPGRR